MNVIINVLNVSKVLLNVMFVLKTDLKDHFVIAQKDTSTLKVKLTVQLVTKNVTLVQYQNMILQFVQKIIVIFVPKNP